MSFGNEFHILGPWNRIEIFLIFISCWNLPKKIPTTKIWSKQILKAINTNDWWCRYEPFCNTDDIYELQLYFENRYVTYKSTYFPRGGGGEGGVMLYMLYRYMYEPLWRFIWFSSSLFWDRVYKSESLGLELRAITNVGCAFDSNRVMRGRDNRYIVDSNIYFIFPLLMFPLS